MKKTIVIGCPGSGKTTFARGLQKRIGIPLFHLDAIWHKPDRTHISRDEYDARLNEILQLDEWIIDGNYSRTVERRLAECDTVFLFDLPVEECLAGAIARIGKFRPDVPWVEEQLDPEFKKEIEQFPEKNLPKIYALLEAYSEGRKVVVFKSRSEADTFLSELMKDKSC